MGLHITSDLENGNGPNLIVVDGISNMRVMYRGFASYTASSFSRPRYFSLLHWVLHGGPEASPRN